MTYRKAITALILSVFAIGTAYAQHVEFFKNYKPVTGFSGLGRTLARTKDGNILFAGTDNIPGVAEIITVIKVDLLGDTLWVQHFGASGKDMEAYSITQLNNGNILVAGSQADTGINVPENAMLMQLSSTGDLQWTKTYPVAGHGTIARDLRVLNDGFAFCGTINDTTTRLSDAWLVRTNLSGDTLWSKRYGGMDSDDAWQMELTPDGGFLLAGGSSSNRTSSAEDDAWIVKTNAIGEQQWRKYYGETDKMDWIWSIAPAVVNGKLSGYVFTGVKNYNGTQSGDLFLAKVDTAGNLLWDKSMSGAEGFRQGFCIEPTADNGFYIAATEYIAAAGYRLLTIKTDKDGNIINQLLYGNAEVITPRGMLINAPGDVFITGERIAAPSGSSTFLTRIRGIDSIPNPVGIIAAERAAATVTAYPNPAVKECTVSSRAEPIGQVLLMDMSGRVLRAVTGNGSLTQRINLEGLLPGAYLLEVATGKPGTKANHHFSIATIRLTIQ